MIALKVCGANGAGHLLSLWFLLDAHSLVVNIVKKKKRNIPMPFRPSLHQGLLRRRCDRRWTVEGQCDMAACLSWLLGVSVQSWR